MSTSRRAIETIMDRFPSGTTRGEFNGDPIPGLVVQFMQNVVESRGGAFGIGRHPIYAGGIEESVPVEVSAASAGQLAIFDKHQRCPRAVVFPMLARRRMRAMQGIFCEGHRTD